MDPHAAAVALRLKVGQQRSLVDGLRFNPNHDKSGKFTTGDPMLPGLATAEDKSVAGRLAATYHSGRDITEELQYGRIADLTERAAVMANDPESGDAALGRILKAQGFDGKPVVATESEVDGLVSRGHMELYRGYYSPKGEGYAADYAQQFATGTLHPGLGIYGNGTYATPNRTYGQEYAGRDGPLQRMVLSKNARVISREDLEAEMDGNTGTPGTSRSQVLSDPGRYAAAKGYDAVVIRSPGIENEDEVLILNRTALVVQGKPA